MEANIIKRAAAAIDCIRTHINLLRSFIYKYKFKTADEEIVFFKEIKPLFLSRQIYYISLYSIETKMPPGGEKVTKEYLERALEMLKVYFDENSEFYSYYRSGSNYLDHKYFVRGNHDLQLITDSSCFESDPRFSTGYDYKIAKIIANNELQQYLEKKLHTKQKPATPQIPQIHPGMELQWTESKAALVEVIYALYFQGGIENGNAEPAGIRDIASFFESMFKVQLGDVYRVFLDIRSRKSGQTKFLDNLKENFLKHLNDSLDKI